MTFKKVSGCKNIPEFEICSWSFKKYVDYKISWFWKISWFQKLIADFKQFHEFEENFGEFINVHDLDVRKVLKSWKFWTYSQI
jgi:hypothetical protein